MSLFVSYVQQDFSTTWTLFYLIMREIACVVDPRKLTPVGLDPDSRKTVAQVMGALPPSPHVILGLRYQDDIPEWITHIAITDKDGISHQGTRNDMMPVVEELLKESKARAEEERLLFKSRTVGPPVVELNNINVSYRGDPVLKDLSWKVLQGERWHLRGSNGSGKSTLLAMLTADHPQSWTRGVSLFGEPREVGKQSYFSVNEHIGHCAPEIHAIFPTHYTVLKAISSGFSVGSFLPPSNISKEQATHIHTLISEFHLNPEAVISDLTLSDQKTVMFLRAIVKSPKLLILDEAFSAMTEDRIAQCRAKVDLGNWTVIAVGHIQHELPMCVQFLQLSPNAGPSEQGSVQA
jgi:ABC-type molybdenum transport system ATPase subunit/photorepair protein PhrA